MDPYKVLGIDPSATDDEVKKAYRALSRKYHPDSNVNSEHPEIAEAKFKEVQAAYDSIVKFRQSGGSGPFRTGNNNGASGSYGGTGYGQSGPGYSYREYQDPFEMFRDFGFGGFGGFSYQVFQESNQYYQAVVNYIQAGQYAQAMNVLSDIADRGSRWQYYHAICSHAMGDSISAMESAEAACRMEPGNPVYEQFLSRIRNQGSAYQTRGGEYGRTTIDLNSICCRILLFQLLCSGCCCGGPMVRF